MNAIGRILLNLAIALDQLANCLWYIEGDGWGQPDEMISARAFRAYLQGLISDTPYMAINLLFFWQRNDLGFRNHCYRAWRVEVERGQFPNHYRLEA